MENHPVNLGDFYFDLKSRCNKTTVMQVLKTIAL